MPAGGCRSIFGVSHGRCQPLHHTRKKGDNYAQRYSVGLPHPGRASKILRGSSKQTNLFFVGCVGIFFFFCLCLVPVQGREFKWVKCTKQLGIFSLLTFDFRLKKKNPKKEKSMISYFLYHPAQGSWSNDLVLSFRFLPGPGVPEQCL